MYKVRVRKKGKIYLRSVLRVGNVYRVAGTKKNTTVPESMKKRERENVPVVLVRLFIL